MILKNKFENRFLKSKTGLRLSNRKSDFRFSINIPKQYRKVLCSVFLLFAVVSTDGVNYLHQSPTHASK